MLEQLKNFDVNRATIDELVGLAAYGRTVANEFAALGVEQPEWLGVQLDALARVIKAKNQDRLAARLRTINASLDNLKTPQERKAALKAEAEKLRKAIV